MGLETREEDGTVSVFEGEALLTRYNADTTASKPGFDVVSLPHGAGASTGTGGVGGASGQNLVLSAPHDHVWHLGLFFCQKLVDGINCWESEAMEGSGKLYGYAEHERYDLETASDAVTISHSATWHSSEGETLLGDRREITVHEPSSDGYLLTWEQELTAIGQTRHLSSETIHGHYSGLSTRFARSLTDGRVLLPDGVDPGHTTLPRDASGPEGRWCDYSGKLDSVHGTDAPESAGIAMFDHPENDSHPTNWFVMTEPFGFLAANPTWRRVLTLREGNSQSWRWGLWVHAGTPEEAVVEDAYRRYSEMDE